MPALGRPRQGQSDVWHCLHTVWDFLQFAAVCEHWAGCAIPEGKLERSHLIQGLADGNRLTLTENKRSDQILCDFDTSLQ